MDNKIVHAAPVPPFVTFVASAVPMVFDNSMSYYEALCALWKWLQDDVINVINNNATVTEEYIQMTKDMKEYMDNYFDNLDVQEEINNKLDAMVEDGTLQELINAYLQPNVTWTFDTVADMQASENLVLGGYARTLGYHALNDGGGAIYKIIAKATPTANGNININDDLDGQLITDIINPELFGAYGDGTHDDTTAFTNMLNYVSAKTTTVNNESTAPKMLLTKDYNISTVTVPDMPVIYLIGEKARIRGGKFAFGASCGWKVRIEGITFDTCANPIDFTYRNLEYGRYEIVNCIFKDCTGVCISLKRRSCQTLIDRCTFRGCEKSLYVEDNDMCKFTNNWLECTTAWGDNHYDVEQYAPNEGSIIIENNMFIPGYSQSGNNPCWIKVGRNALITGNRFSGENATIHPVIVDYDAYSTFNRNSTVYPVVDIRDNPIIAGKTPILLEHACGVINLISNSGWAGGAKVMVCASAGATTYFTNLPYTDLTINISENGGRTFNFRNRFGVTIPGSYAPSIDTVLQRFIQCGVSYQGNNNYEFVTSLSNSNHTLNIQYLFGSDTIDPRKTNAVIISGKLAKGGGDYFEPFVALVSMQKYYESGEYRFRGFAKILTENNQNLSLAVLINGSSYITSVPAGENLTLSITASGGNGNETAEFFGMQEAVFVPIGNRVCN